MIIIVMGPSGAGKTTIGRALARELGWHFVEADDLHSAENIQKIRDGIGLSHLDRMPWLSEVRRRIEQIDAAGKSAVVACSALTNEYRGILSAGLNDIRFVYLRADPVLLQKRLRERRQHFAGPEILASQLSTLEAPEPAAALTLDASATPDALVRAIRSAYSL